MQKRGPQISELVGGVMRLQQLYKANEAKQTNQSYATPEHVDPGLGADLVVRTSKGCTRRLCDALERAAATFDGSCCLSNVSCHVRGAVLGGRAAVSELTHWSYD